MVKAAILLSCLASSFLLAQTPSFRMETLHGRQAYVIENGKMRVSALRGGGHIAELQLLTSDARLGINPLYIPPYQTIEPYNYDQARDGSFYGTGPKQWLDAGYMGQLLCFPSFGPPSSNEEARNGQGYHGEAVTVEWKQTKTPQIDSGGVTFYYGAELPKTQYRIERILHLAAGETALHVEEWFENLAAFDRPFNRDEHVTFGPPFLAVNKTMLDMPGTRGMTKRGPAAGDIDWPKATLPDGSSMDLRAFRSPVRTSVFRAILVDASRSTAYFTMYNSEYPLLVGYIFSAEENPWICDWQENQSAQATPRFGKVIARGIEFGTSPFDEGLRKSVERGTLFGAPAYGWINGLQRIKISYTVFLAEIPAGFGGVSDVQCMPGEIVVRERNSMRRIIVPSGARP
jgi:hypothetical protein